MAHRESASSDLGDIRIPQLSAHLMPEAAETLGERLQPGIADQSP